MELTDDILSELAKAQYGAPNTAELPSGDKLRLRVEVDDTTSINDFDGYGRISSCFDYHRQSERPPEFDGAARKIQVERGCYVWWQPWEGFLQLSADDQRKGVQEVTDILQFGFHVLILELCRGEDAYGDPIVVAFEALGGVEACADTAYIKSIISDQWAELDREGSNA